MLHSIFGNIYYGVPKVAFEIISNSFLFTLQYNLKKVNIEVSSFFKFKITLGYPNILIVLSLIVF